MTGRSSQKYFPSFEVAELVGLSGMAVAKITSSFMVLTSDGQKNNLGLSIKFDAKAMKVIDYSRKNGRHWEFSDKAVELLREYKAKFPENTMGAFRGAVEVGADALETDIHLSKDGVVVLSHVGPGYKPPLHMY